jgi:hypothetical protein
MRTVTFTFADEERTITEEDARWLLGQVRSAPVLTEAASSAAAKLSDAIATGRGVETTLAERQELIEALERGAAKPRSAELRRLEIELRTAAYAETSRGAEFNRGCRARAAFASPRRQRRLPCRWRPPVLASFGHVLSERSRNRSGRRGPVWSWARRGRILRALSRCF